MVLQRPSDAPLYYNLNIHSQTVNHDQAAKQKQYIEQLLGRYISMKDQAKLIMAPLPPEIGMVQCTIERNKSGFNKINPKYILSLSDSNNTPLMMLESKKIQSKTTHLRVEINTGNQKYMSKQEENYIGRVRSNMNNSQFYIFDTGIKKNEVKAGQVNNLIRKQYGSIIYNSDKYGNKGPRQIEVYLPLVDDESMQKQQTMSWPDDELKKQNIHFEYQQQKLMSQNQQKKN